MVRKSVMFSNVIVDIAFPRRSFVFSQSGCGCVPFMYSIVAVVVGVTLSLVHRVVR